MMSLSMAWVCGPVWSGGVGSGVAEELVDTFFDPGSTSIGVSSFFMGSLTSSFASQWKLSAPCTIALLRLRTTRPSLLHVALVKELVDQSAEVACDAMACGGRNRRSWGNCAESLLSLQQLRTSHRSRGYHEQRVGVEGGHGLGVALPGCVRLKKGRTRGPPMGMGAGCTSPWDLLLRSFSPMGMVAGPVGTSGQPWIDSDGAIRRSES